jgi:hypothetical protein
MPRQIAGGLINRWCVLLAAAPHADGVAKLVGTGMPKWGAAPTQEVSALHPIPAHERERNWVQGHLSLQLARSQAFHSLVDSE